MAVITYRPTAVISPDPELGTEAQSYDLTSAVMDPTSLCGNGLLKQESVQWGTFAVPVLGPTQYKRLFLDWSVSTPWGALSNVAPDSDLSRTNWFDEDGNTVQLYRSIDEEVVNYSEYVETVNSSQSNSYTAQFGDITSKPGNTEGIGWYITYERIESGSSKLAVDVGELGGGGTTVHTTFLDGSVGQRITTTGTLSASEVAALSNWDDLFLKFRKAQSNNGEWRVYHGGLIWPSSATCALATIHFEYSLDGATWVVPTGWPKTVSGAAGGLEQVDLALTDELSQLRCRVYCKAQSQTPCGASANGCNYEFTINDVWAEHSASSPSVTPSNLGGWVG